MTYLALLLSLALVAYHVPHFRRPRRRRALPEPMAPWTPPPSAPTICFLVPAWNDAADVPGFVDAFRALSYPSKRLVLAAGGDDGTLDVARSCALGDDVIVIEQRPGQGKQGALRESAAQCDAELVYLTDIDCRPSDEVVHALVRPLVEGSAAVVTGPSCPLPAQRALPFVRAQWAVDLATQPPRPTIVTGLLGRNAALTRAALDATGAFAAAAASGTDYTLAKELLRSDHEIHFVPGAPMPTQYPEGFETYVRKQARWIRNVFVLGRRYRAFAEVRATAVTMLVPVGLLTLGAIALAGVPAAGAVAGLAIVHSLLRRHEHTLEAGLEPAPGAYVRHFVADQGAGLLAGWQALRGDVVW